jgi:hypothetical protein
MGVRRRADVWRPHFLCPNCNSVGECKDCKPPPIKHDPITHRVNRLVFHHDQQAHPVIYVSFNYRVNSLGFTASTVIEKAAASGKASLNAGLYDMQSALRWVQRNIEAFGGDKNKVTGTS